mmetsp:Transcript_609/g.1911  ORF Transcript_609/g.1911 Transcript_609/m.1911 type:complete len:295 (-) Transcript_609:54-938(-)
MGTVHGVSLKYVLLSVSAGAVARTVVHGSAAEESVRWPQLILLLLLMHVCLVNGLLAVLVNFGVGMGILGKHAATGTVPLWSYLLFAGFHAPNWLYTRLQHLADQRRRLPAASEVAPGWWVGGRYAAELDRHWAGTVDLTCEFPEGCMASSAEYLLLPCWDGTPPKPEEIDRAALFAVSARADGDVIVHCAHGRGRSTTVMCACLVKAGLHADWEAAFEAVRSRRQVVRLNKGMRNALTGWQAEYAVSTPKRAAAELPGCNSEVTTSRASGLLRRMRTLLKRALIPGHQQVKET